MQAQETLDGLFPGEKAVKTGWPIQQNLDGAVSLLGGSAGNSKAAYIRIYQTRQSETHARWRWCCFHKYHS